MPKGARASCRLCRREGIKLFLKGSRCEGAKCAVNRREYPPGMHGWRRSKMSEYAIRLREKQRAKRYYGVRERQFRRYFDLADRQKGNTGENLFRLLERRLDNVIYRAGMAHSHGHARQMIVHGNIRVNGKRVDRPSFLVVPEQLIEPYDSEETAKRIGGYMEQNADRNVPSWIAVERQLRQVRVTGMPPTEEVGVGFRPQLIVETCSR